MEHKQQLETINERISSVLDWFLAHAPANCTHSWQGEPPIQWCAYCTLFRVVSVVEGDSLTTGQ